MFNGSVINEGNADFTDQDLRTLAGIFDAVHQAIGPDLGATMDDTLVSREDLFRHILDINGIRQYGPWNDPEKVLIDRFLALPYATQCVYRARLLPFDSYEVGLY